MIFFIYFKNVFDHVTLENMFRIINNSIYFQNIVVKNPKLHELITRDSLRLRMRDFHGFAFILRQLSSGIFKSALGYLQVY